MTKGIDFRPCAPADIDFFANYEQFKRLQSKYTS